MRSERIYFLSFFQILVGFKSRFNLSTINNSNIINVSSINQYYSHFFYLQKFFLQLHCMKHNVPVVGNVGELTAAFVSTVNELCGERKPYCCIISPNIFNHMLANVFSRCLNKPLLLLSS